MARDKKAYNAYLKRYMLKRYHKRRADAIVKLGGKCNKCGAIDNLQLDHIDPAAKSFDVAKSHSASQAKWDAEIAKCQLLCQPCHNKKTIADLGYRQAKGFHGTISTVRYCKCDKCRAAKSKYNKERRLRSKQVGPRGLEPRKPN